MADKVSLEVSLSSDEHDILVKAKEEFGVASEGKALRCAIEWCVANGISLTKVPGNNLTSYTYEFAPSQLAFLQKTGQDLEGSPSDAVQAILRAAIKHNDDRDIFEVVRCRTKGNCPGSQGVEIKA